MELTFGVIAIFAVVLFAVGLLLTRSVRWGPIPAVEAVRPSRLAGGELTIALSVIVVLAAVGVLVWFWGVMSLPH
jgi:hypothetical protein